MHLNKFKVDYKLEIDRFHLNNKSLKYSLIEAKECYMIKNFQIKFVYYIFMSKAKISIFLYKN